MSTTAQVVLKSGKSITIEKLLAINARGQTKPLTDFNNFLLPKGNSLTFVGEKNFASLFSDEIEYVEFSTKD